MASYKVLIINLGFATYQFERDILEPINAEVILTPRECVTEKDIIEVAGNADAILVREAPVTRRVIASLARCKIIARYGVGIDNVDVDFARQKKIYVSNVPDYGTEDVSDHAVALLLACIRSLLPRDQNLRRGIFEFDINAGIYRTAGKNMGIIGYGKIARAVHRKWRGFQPSKVLIYDPFVEDDVVIKNGAKKVDLDTLLAESDYIMIHAPLTPETRHIINAAALGKMKKTAILINTSRGGLIDENALNQALQKGRILAAGLDVFEKEPIGQDHPLVGFPNVVLTSHVAWFSRESTRELQTKAAHEVRRVLSGSPPLCWVNRW